MSAANTLTYAIRCMASSDPAGRAHLDARTDAYAYLQEHDYFSRFSQLVHMMMVAELLRVADSYEHPPELGDFGALMDTPGERE